jgi:hypothetical protein
MLATAVSLFVAPLALAQTPVSDAEFKCQSKATAGSTKFVANKSKCINTCFANVWKGIGNPADCYPPYGGTTLTCITDPIKSAEQAFQANTAKNCDQNVKPTLGCPACYNPGNDCSAGGYAGDYMQTIEGQVDSFVPGVGCELAGATKEEQKCETNTSKSLVKQVAGVVKCYTKCMTNARKGLVTRASCLPPASDPVTQACIIKVDSKAIDSVNKLCSGKNVSPVDSIPDCANPTANDYPDGATWVNLVDVAIAGNVPGNFCENP